MAKVTIDFVGLFLFQSTGAVRRVAVIDAERDGVEHGGKKLKKHLTSFHVPNAIAADWPLIAGKYELKRLIQFDVEGQLSGAKWELPLFAQCGNDVPDGFFNEHKPLQTHAIIEFQAGDLCTWRFVDKDGKPGAAGTRLTFVNPSSFTIRRDDGKYISLDVTRDCEIMIENREEASDPGNDADWLWYYVATGSSCTNTPASFDFEATCDAPPGIRPLSLGCSNSQWP